MKGQNSFKLVVSLKIDITRGDNYNYYAMWILEYEFVYELFKC